MNWQTHFHALRKTLSTLMAANGMSQRVRQAHMRHTDPRLTENTYMDERLLPIAEELSRIPAFAPVKAPSQSPAPAPKPTPITCGSAPVPHKASQPIHKTGGSEGLGEASDGNSVAPEQNQDMVRKAIEMLAQAIAAASLGTNGQGSAPNGTEPSKERVMGLEPTTFTLATAQGSTLMPENTTLTTNAKTACTPACTPPVQVGNWGDSVAEAMLVIAKLPLSAAEKAVAMRRLLAE